SFSGGDWRRPFRTPRTPPFPSGRGAGTRRYALMPCVQVRCSLRHGEPGEAGEIDRAERGDVRHRKIVSHQECPAFEFPVEPAEGRLGSFPVRLAEIVELLHDFRRVGMGVAPEITDG